MLYGQPEVLHCEGQNRYSVNEIIVRGVTLMMVSQLAGTTKKKNQLPPYPKMEDADMSKFGRSLYKLAPH